MFGVGMEEMLIILVIVLIIFGPGKLPQIGADLGKSIRNFKKSSHGEDDMAKLPENKEEKKEEQKT